MANRNQLRVLNDTQATAIRALANGLAVMELVTIYWPAPAATTVYAWWNPLSADAPDLIYHNEEDELTPLADWLDGLDLVVAFEAQDEAKAQKFHEISRTAAIGDDTVQFRFRNDDGAFEALATTYPGAKLEIYWHFPQLEDGAGATIQMWQGKLRTPESIQRDFVTISAVEGFASPDLVVPNSNHFGNCRFHSQFGGRYDPLLVHNPCDYDKHTGGTRGNLDGEGNPFTSCGGTKQDCIARLGDLLSYGGFDAVTDTSHIGGGQHTTVSETQGQSTRLKEAIDVWYGAGQANKLKLLDFAKEYNPSDKNQDKGTIRTLFEGSEGPIQGISEFELMDSSLPRPDGLGLETRLGTQQQSATNYSANVSNYNRLAHFRADKNPIDPRGITASQITAKTKFEGRNTVRIYSDADTYSEVYTQLRAWVALDLIRDTTYGLREDPARHSIEDFIYLASKGSTFNGIAQGKSAHQQITDICQAGPWFLPFNHNGIKRWLAVEDYDLTADDIPFFTTLGSGRNILYGENGLPRLTPTKRDYDQIPFEITLTFEDAAHNYLERPLLFPDPALREIVARNFGDSSLLNPPQQHFAFGVNNEDDARKIGWYLLDYGPFYTGGARNNGTVVFYGFAFDPDYIDLHVNKVIELEADELDQIKDRDGVVFTHFIVTGLRNFPNGEIEVTAQAFKALRKATCSLVDWTNVHLATPDEPGKLTKSSGLTCEFDTGHTGDAGARSLQQITGESDWEMQFSFDSDPIGLGFGGLTTRSDYFFNQNQMEYCIFVSEEPDDPFAANFLEIYELGTLKASFSSEDGYYQPGDMLKIKGTSDAVTYWHKANGVWFQIYDSATPATYPMYAAASLGCTDRTIDNVSLCQIDTTTGGTSGTQAVADSAYVFIDRIWRDQDFQAGVPGIYVAAGPTTAPTPTETWELFQLYRDIEGYAEIYETTREAIIGTAASVLPDTDTGLEYVDVTLRPGQSLVTFTVEQQAAGQGGVYLGGEIFLYRVAEQQDDDPNVWRLSDLTNRGAFETTSFMLTHAEGEDFAFLDDAVVFVPLASSEIGQTRDYKGITAGQELSDVSPKSFQFQAPNFVPTTPEGYEVSMDLERNEVLHDWSGLAMEGPVNAASLVYEVWYNSDGSGPTIRLWYGNADSWREPISASEDRYYWLRAVTSASTGDYVQAEPFPLTVTYTPGGATSNLIVAASDGSPSYSTIIELQAVEAHGFIITQPAANKARLDLGQYTVNPGVGMANLGSAYLGGSITADMDEGYPHLWTIIQTYNPTSAVEGGNPAISLDRTAPTSVGRRDSHYIRFFGRSHDGSTTHAIEFRLGVDVQSNDAAISEFQIRARYDTSTTGIPFRLDTLGGLTLGMTAAESVPGTGVITLNNASSNFYTAITTQNATASIIYRLPTDGPAFDDYVLAGTAPVSGIVNLSWNAPGGSGTVTHTTGALTVNLPVFGNGTDDIKVGTRTGNTTQVVTATGTFPTDNLLSWDASGNAVDSLIAANNVPLLTSGNAFVASSGQQITVNEAGTTTVSKVLDLIHNNSSGAGATGLGSYVRFGLETTGGSNPNQDAATLQVTWSDATHATASSKFSVFLRNAGAALAEKFTFDGNGNFTATGLLKAGSGPTTITDSVGNLALTVAATTVASGTTGRVLYDNAGVLGEYAITGTGSVVMNTSPTVGGGSFTAIATFGIRSTGSGAFDLRFANTENLTGNHTLNISLSNVNRALALAGDVTFAAAFTTSGANALTLTTTGSTNVTLPTTGTLATLAGSETFTNKTLTNSTNVLGGVTLTLGSDATGDVYYRSSGGVLTRLGVGSNGQVLTLASGLPSWATVTGTGTVTNTGTLTANKIIKGNGSADVTASKVTITDPTTAGTLTWGTDNATITLQGTGTVVNRDSTDTLTNKTLTSSTNVLGGVTLTLGSDATGDVYYRSSGGVLTRLAVGSAGQFIGVSAGLPAWSTPAGGGDVSSDTSTSVDGEVALFKSTSGKLIKRANGVSAQITRDGIGSTSTDGLLLQNTTNAANGAQQYGPRFRMTGQAYRSTSGGSSRLVELIQELRTVQATTAPSGTWAVSMAHNSGTFLDLLTITSDAITTTTLTTPADVTISGTTQTVRLGLGVAPHASNALVASAGVAIGNSYTGTTAPTSGMIIEGSVGVGTSAPASDATAHLKGGNQMVFYFSDANGDSGHQSLRLVFAGKKTGVITNSAFVFQGSTDAGAFDGAIGNTMAVWRHGGLTLGGITDPGAGNMYITAGKLGIQTTAFTYDLQLNADSAGKPGVGGLWTVVSDERLKEQIVDADLSRCYDIIRNVPLRRFNWRKDTYTGEQVRDRGALGFLAREVQKEFPKSVTRTVFTRTTGQVVDDALDLNNDQMMMALFGAVKHQAALLDAALARIAELEG